MPDIEQRTFFGASIRGINSNIGWGSQPSTLEINLVEDPVNNDEFIPSSIGWPVYFDYYGFTFGGIVQNYYRNGSSSGNPLFKVLLNDPREILTGVQIILSGYTGATTAVVNLYNVYGYLESELGYGGSQINDTGIPWKLIRNALTVLISSTPINFRAQPYLIDISELPNLPDEFRIGGGGFSMSIMEYIDAVCEAGSCDYFFKLVPTSAGHVIKLYTISRSTQPSLGLITEFLNDNDEIIAKEVGFELRNERTSNFLVGGAVQQIFYQTPYVRLNNEGEPTIETEEEEASGEHDYSDDNIVQFWGFDPFGNVNLQRDPPDETNDHPYFILDTRGIFVEGVAEYYVTDVQEIRAILAGQASWEAFLWYYDQVGDPTTNPHFNKATKLNLLGPLPRNIGAVINNLDLAQINAMDGRALLDLAGKEIGAAGGAIQNLGFVEENLKRFYEILLAFAQEYYGRKYMVRIPFVYSKVDSETGQITTSQEPVDGGYVEEAYFPNAIGYGLLPVDTNFITDENNLVQCFVRFDDAEALDLSKLSGNDYTLSPYRDEDGLLKFYAFIKCQLEPKVVYLEKVTGYSPRVIVTLPAPVFPRLGDGCVDFAGILRPILLNKATELAGEQEANVIVDRIFGGIASDQLFFPMCGKAELPDLVAAPLKSNVLTYGPWYVDGAPGFTNCQQEETLVPWEYGSYELLNLAGESMVNDSVSQQQISEAGSLEIPGVPTFNLGDQLINGGPYITSINIAIGLDGVTSSYRMETWTQRFGKTNKQLIERLQKMNRAAQQQRRLLRQRFSNPAKLDILVNYLSGQPIVAPPERVDRHSSAAMLAGEIRRNDDTEKSTINVAMMPHYHVATQISNNYENKAVMSLDGLLVPFTTATEHDYLPHFETPTSSGTSGRSNLELNPFTSGNHTFFSAHGTTLSDELKLSDKAVDVRVLGLRGPVIIAGWGYDTTGKPVPNEDPESPTTQFESDYLNRPNNWKVGPLNVAWNHATKTWDAANGGSMRVARLVQNLVGGLFASGNLLTPVFLNGAITNYTTGEMVRVYDPFAFQFPVTPSGARILVAQEQTSREWFVFAAGAF